MKFNANVSRLALAQALAGANGTVVYATGAIVGHFLAPKPSLATLPITVFVLGMALASLPIGWITQRYGRLIAAYTGSACGVLMGLIAYLGLLNQSFVLFCLAMVFGGAYAATVLTYRFSAAECVPEQDRAMALSTVLAGGVLAGVFGAQMVSFTMNSLPGHAYAATYLASSIFALLSAGVLYGVKFPTKLPPVVNKEGVNLSLTLRQPRFIIAMLCGLVSYMLMNFLMTAAPLAMQLCGLSGFDTNQGVEMHIIAMYLPSFFTGRIITKFGAKSVVQAGLLLICLSAIAGMTGLTVNHFWISLILLGVGWNFGFLGASAMVLDCHKPEEAARVQSINDFVIFAAMATGSFISGGLLTRYGWNQVAELSIIPVIIAICLLFIWGGGKGNELTRR